MLPINQKVLIDGKMLTVLPALIDPHVHFRVPGGEHKEDWKTAALAAVSAGVTRVCDMPNNTPACTTLQEVKAKKALIDAQLQAVSIPLRYGLYFGADKSRFDQIALVSHECVALKIFMGSSTGGLVIDTDKALDEAFHFAKQANMLVAVHAEDEALLAQKRIEYAGQTDPSTHSKMRPKQAAILATKKAIALSAKHDVALYILHLSTLEELELVREAKRQGLKVFAETTTHHLFLTEADYASFGTLVQMNPPLRTQEDQDALWRALQDGTLDTIGTDHAPHTLEEKKQPFGQAPSGIPGIETLLPLMLDAVHRKKLSLERLMQLTRYNIESLFGFAPNNDVVLVDLELKKQVQDAEMHSKCGWTPYRGRMLTGWPIYTILNGQIFGSNQATPEGKQQLEAYLQTHQGGFVANSQ
ncbi:MAG: Dihydroorotase [Chlamydiales bacterium]|nr:Dihydroorotase [Chlamydiales bacterium]